MRLDITLFVLLLLEACAFRTTAFIPKHGGDRRSTTGLHLSPTSASLLAGSIAGASGVIVAFPFDTIKTKTQAASNSDSAVPKSNLELIKNILEEEGFKGFYAGVKPAALGQFFIKAVAFSTNSNALLYLTGNDMGSASNPSFLALISAASLSGFVASFLVCPIERIKILMQAGNDSDENRLEKLPKALFAVDFCLTCLPSFTYRAVSQFCSPC